MHTFQTVYDLILEHRESDEPDAILEALKSFDGKMVSTRILDKMPGGKDKWILERRYGMTHIKSREYYNNGGNSGISLLLAHTEASFPFNWNELESKNPAYFSGRRERNHARMEVMNNKEQLEKMASILNRIERAKSELIAAFAEFDTMTEYGAPFSQDNYELERACKMRVTPRGKSEERIQLV